MWDFIYSKSPKIRTSRGLVGLGFSDFPYFEAVLLKFRFKVE